MGRTFLNTLTQEPGARRSLRLAGLVALMVAVAACGKKDDAPPGAGTAAPGAAAPAGTAPPVAALKLTVNELLQRAKTAEKEGRTVAPANDNAMDYFLQIIAQEPSNAQATQALVDLFPIAASSAESAINARNVPEAERIIGMLDKSSPGSYTVTTLRAKLDTQRAAGERLEAEKLAEEQRRLQLLQEQAATAAQAAQTPAAPAATPAATPPAQAPATAADDGPAATAPAQQESVPPASTAAAAPATPAPGPASAAASGGGQTREARLLRQVPPAFPPEAVRKRQSGWVEVRITVGPQGNVTGATVVRSQPSRVFDRAAVAAVQQWRFEPALRDGEPVAAQRTQRIEFKL